LSLARTQLHVLGAAARQWRASHSRGFSMFDYGDSSTAEKKILVDGDKLDLSDTM
jgi:hypothetical protein